MGEKINIQLKSFAEAGEYNWRWPSKNVEHFNKSWTGEVMVNGMVMPFRHALGKRLVYGRERVHSVTWLEGTPMVEGVEANDYERSHSLISVLRQPDKKHVYYDQDIPSGYDGFTIVNHRSDIEAPYSPSGLAVKIISDNIAEWVTHAAIRAISYDKA